MVVLQTRSTMSQSHQLQLYPIRLRMSQTQSLDVLETLMALDTHVKVTQVHADHRTGGKSKQPDFDRGLAHSVRSSIEHGDE